MVTAALLAFEGVVPHDVKPGPYIEVRDAGGEEEVRFSEVLDRLDPHMREQVSERFSTLAS
jgi:hypothetical protein